MGGGLVDRGNPITRAQCEPTSLQCEIKPDRLPDIRVEVWDVKQDGPNGTVRSKTYAISKDPLHVGPSSAADCGPGNESVDPRAIPRSPDLDVLTTEVEFPSNRAAEP